MAGNNHGLKTTTRYTITKLCFVCERSCKWGGRLTQRQAGCQTKRGPRHLLQGNGTVAQGRRPSVADQVYHVVDSPCRGWDFFAC